MHARCLVYLTIGHLAVQAALGIPNIRTNTIRPPPQYQQFKTPNYQQFKCPQFPDNERYAKTIQGVICVGN